jgi:hypothetical protein
MAKNTVHMLVPRSVSRVCVRESLPELPRRRLWLSSPSAWCDIARVQVCKLLSILLFLFLTAQLPRSVQTGFFLLALDLLAIDNLHGARHAFLFGQTLVLAVLVHACGSNDEGADGPVGCRLDGCWNSWLTTAIDKGEKFH